MSTAASRTFDSRTLPFRTLDGSTVHLDRAEIDAALGGNVLFPDSAGYADARAIWNAMIERKPAAIVRVENERDVIKTVAFASAKRLLLAVKGGGHNIAGSALVEGGLVIDLSPMRKITVDAAARTARVEPGATLADVDRATQQHGLIVPTGINSTTGIAGLTLGGGFGWTTRKLGLTIDNLKSARVVTADGEVTHVDRERHPDLYWAIRGGGGNFGVVTEFEFTLHPLGPEVVAGMVVHPFADFGSVLKQYQAALARASDDLTCWAVMRKAPPLPFLPTEWHGREIVVLAMCHVGPRAEAEAATAELRKIWQSAFDPLLTPGARNYWKSHDVAAFGDEATEVLRDAIATLPTEECEVFVAHVGGAMTRVPAAATAWPNRAPHFVVNVHTRWRDAKDDERCRGWARKLHERLAPHAMGSVYVNFIPDDEARVNDAYGRNFERLASIKRRFDPANLFRTNQNIAPR
jgi:FAD/FMN-containing dehydrogenase